MHPSIVKQKLEEVISSNREFGREHGELYRRAKELLQNNPEEIEKTLETIAKESPVGQLIGLQEEERRLKKRQEKRQENRKLEMNKIPFPINLVTTKELKKKLSPATTASSGSPPLDSPNGESLIDQILGKNDDLTGNVENSIKKNDDLTGNLENSISIPVDMMSNYGINTSGESNDDETLLEDAEIELRLQKHAEDLVSSNIHIQRMIKEFESHKVKKQERREEKRKKKLLLEARQKGADGTLLDSIDDSIDEAKNGGLSLGVDESNESNTSHDSDSDMNDDPFAPDNYPTLLADLEKEKFDREFMDWKDKVWHEALMQQDVDDDPFGKKGPPRSFVSIRHIDPDTGNEIIQEVGDIFALKEGDLENPITSDYRKNPIVRRMKINWPLRIVVLILAAISCCVSVYLTIFGWRNTSTQPVDTFGLMGVDGKTYHATYHGRASLVNPESNPQSDAEESNRIDHASQMRTMGKYNP